MEIIDIVIAIPLLFGLVKGIQKGLLVEIASLLALALGIFGAIHFSEFTQQFIIQYLDWELKYIKIVAFALTFIGIMIVINLVGKMFTKLAESLALGSINKILGAVFGMLKWALILSILIMLFEKVNNQLFSIVPEKNLQKSILYKPVKTLAPTIYPKLLELSKFKSQENETV